jgi:hypothetical protein
MTQKTIIGRAEEVRLPELTDQPVCARVDSGAKTAAIWASDVAVTAEGLEVVFFDQDSSFYSGKKVVFKNFDETVVSSSNGQAEQRYKVRLLIVIGGRRIRAWFTLANRSTQVYPVLIGRNILRGKFIVDVSLGTGILLAAEELRTKALRHEIEERGE